MRQTPLEHRLSALIGPLLAAEGVALVQVSLISEGGGRSLQILAERLETGTLDLESCRKLSRTIGTHLEIEDPIPGAYRLEISSPGIDRPLTRIDDFRRFAGFEAKIELDAPVNGQKRFHGRLAGTQGDETVLLTDETGETAALPFADIARAKLKLTQELIDFSRKQVHNKAADQGETKDDRTAASR